MKNFSKFIVLLLFIFMPFISVKADEKEVIVKNQEELKAAINDSTIDLIVLGNDIKTTERFYITRDLIIDGANHTISYSIENQMADFYILDFYYSTSTIRNIKLKGAEGGINTYSSIITLEGIIDLSNNKNCGIKLEMDYRDTVLPNIFASKATIINTDESSTSPTLLLDVPFDVIIGYEYMTDKFDIDSWPFSRSVFLIDIEKMYFFLDKSNIPTGDNILDLSDTFVNDEVKAKEEEEKKEDEEKKDQIKDESTNDKTTSDSKESLKEDDLAKKNPNTYDSALFSLIFGIIAFIFLGYTYSKAIAKDEN